MGWHTSRWYLGLAACAALHVATASPILAPVSPRNPLFTRQDADHENQCPLINEHTEECGLGGSGPDVWGWVSMSIDSSSPFTAYTVITTINTVRNITTSTTAWNSIPTDVQLIETNEAGTRIKTVTYHVWDDNFSIVSTLSTVVAYPTPFIKWPEYYKWSGTAYSPTPTATTASGGGEPTTTCVQTVAEVVPSDTPETVAIHSQPQLPPGTYVGNQSSLPDLDKDPYGLHYTIELDDDNNSGMMYYYLIGGKLFPDEPPIVQCRMGGQGPHLGTFQQTSWLVVGASSTVYDNSPAVPTANPEAEPVKSEPAAPPPPPLANHDPPLDPGQQEGIKPTPAPAPVPEPGAGNGGSGNSGTGNGGSGNGGTGNGGTGNAGTGNAGTGNGGTGNGGAGNGGTGNSATGSNGATGNGDADTSTGNQGSGNADTGNSGVGGGSTEGSSGNGTGSSDSAGTGGTRSSGGSGSTGSTGGDSGNGTTGTGSGAGSASEGTDTDGVDGPTDGSSSSGSSSNGSGGGGGGGASVTTSGARPGSGSGSGAESGTTLTTAGSKATSTTGAGRSPVATALSHRYRLAFGTLLGAVSFVSLLAV
ncbi:hypothetical protein B0H66DRAFT_642794 [Apodospora peruviana]|uniref:Uncharacterized protein n=1 Tax=Apodospora peruviana TaxID=516989 RepID=A0AAE0M1I9_9PEZI|nr:hypothetical protein B0H66DRAFT_642794 [Apodospora peruviana]